MGYEAIRYTERIKSEFINYHGEHFLSQMFPDRKAPLYWLDFAFVSVSEHLRPLHHILLMEFRKAQPKVFIKPYRIMSRMGMGHGHASISCAIIMEKTALKKYPSAISMGRQSDSSIAPNAE